MKKILVLVFILFFSMHICWADNETAEDIDSYFNEESQQSAEQNVQLNGFVQYSEPSQEVEEQAIHLDESVDKTGINFSKPQKIESKSLITESKKPLFKPIQDELESASKFATQEYNIKPVSTTYGRKFGKFCFGTMYDSSLDSSAQANYSTGFFTKYNGKHFAISTAFSKNTNSNYDSYTDKLYFVPELKLTKRLSLLDVMQTDVNQINKKNELVLRYTPHSKRYADEVQFELGAGQSYFNDNYLNSSVRFSTKFKL